MTAWMRLTGEDPLQLVRIRDDSFGYADLSDGFLRLIVVNQGFETDFFGMADQIFAGGGVFMDGGANHGLLSFGLAGRFGAAIDFHLFEPNPKLVTSIFKTRQRYPDMRLTLNPCAISDFDGEVCFQIVADQTGASHITADGGEGVSMPSIRLDSYIAAAGLARVDLLKLDVEGYELPALQGATRALEQRTVRAVYFEYFEKWLVRVGPPSDLIGFLRSVGFEVCFCRAGDFAGHGPPTHQLAGSGVPLRPVGADALPPMTDLFAAPKENVVPL
jgi:FkbM family methyltransferase